MSNRQVAIVVVTTARTADEVADARRRGVSADPALGSARWTSFDEWRWIPNRGVTLFIDGRVDVGDRLSAGFMSALDRGVDVVTSYYRRLGRNSATTQIALPLGACLESAWRENLFGGPCFAAAPSAFSAIDSAAVNGTFKFWPAYAAATCRGLGLAIVPEALYAIPGTALDAPSHAEIEVLLTQFHALAPASVDLGWLLKTALTQTAARALTTGASDDEGVQPRLGRALYDRFISMPDNMLCAYAGIDASLNEDVHLRAFARIRSRLSKVLARWSDSEPRVYLYGAGEHSKLLLALCPELGPLVAGFIDRRPMNEFLGRRCVTPDAFRNEMADAIIYSSREYEHEMFARMRHLTVEHVLIYRDGPEAPELSTDVRLRNRFGHAAPDRTALYAMYKPPAWVTGYTSHGDAEFLVGMIAAVQPRVMVELGVASGVSSAAILHGLDQLPDVEGGRMLYSCDVRETCYFDPSRPTGDACVEMYPTPRAAWYRHCDEMTGRRVVKLVPPHSVDLMFIDALHAQPWPLLDVLHLSEIAKPGSWMILHDVDMPKFEHSHVSYGVRWLYDAWPFNKIKGIGDYTSIGAIQLPEDSEALLEMAIALVQKPWEHMPTMWHVKLPEAFAEVEKLIAARIAAAEPIVA